MEIYLPIAEMSVHWLILIGMGGAVGFLSGMFGVGGGFLLTPLLIFYGIPPGVAVATTASHVTASSVSGALTYLSNGAIDLKLATVMTVSGIVGTGAGVWLFGVLSAAGQIELIISASYVILLGTIGALMLRESMETLAAARAGQRAPSARAQHHSWMHGLPFKMRFRDSRLYISVIPPVAIGFSVGVLSSVMGVGGGFVLVPAMIYLLRVPAKIVMGTSLLQIVFVTASSTILHAVSDFTVDMMLAVILIAGGVIGAQYGVRMAARLRGEQLRFLLALLVLAVAVRLLYGLLVTPTDPFSVTVNGL
ncbi:MAG TPA: sulfite exporter TauE/SafE family protein [Rhizomicrobium sp.]|nr:sulfite exporter TauE/SafE family protein [Rhizomicrobium sp.]